MKIHRSNLVVYSAIHHLQQRGNIVLTLRKLNYKFIRISMTHDRPINCLVVVFLLQSIAYRVDGFSTIHIKKFIIRFSFLSLRCFNSCDRYMVIVASGFIINDINNTLDVQKSRQLTKMSILLIVIQTCVNGGYLTKEAREGLSRTIADQLRLKLCTFQSGHHSSANLKLNEDIVS